MRGESPSPHSNFSCPSPIEGLLHDTFWETRLETPLLVIPAKAGIQINPYQVWIPAFAGMTSKGFLEKLSCNEPARGEGDASQGG